MHLLSFMLTLVICHATKTLQPETKISQGVLKGQYLQTFKNRTISGFRGIPYAEPPIGSLRFEPTRPPKPWNGTLNATATGNVCPQIYVALGSDEVEGDEDCLYLNVYTPKLKFSNTIKTSDLLPVLLYIHGGAFLLGSANDDNPSYLLDRDIVLVTINYRLGPLGFASMGDRILPGNNGLKDQSMAIQWTKLNIAHFGGDPDSITLFGQSAGGVSTHFQMLSPLTKDLIKGVISQSGTAFAAWALDHNNRTIKNTLRLAASFNCPINSSQEIINCLKKVNAYAITKKQFDFYEWHDEPLVAFRPVVEKDIPGAFLPDHPKTLIKSGKAAAVPFMTGVTTEDGAMKSPGLFADLEKLVDLSVNFDRIAPITFLYTDTASDPNHVTTRIKDFYFRNQSFDNSSLSRQIVTDLYTDSYFLAGANEAAWLHSNYTLYPVYYYVFGYRGVISFSDVFGGGGKDYDYGVCHADDTLYLFQPGDLFKDYEPNENDKNMIDLLTELWTNFAYAGNPTPGADALVNSKWDSVKTANLEYFMIKNYTDTRMEEKPFWNRTQFWKTLSLN